MFASGKAMQQELGLIWRKPHQSTDLLFVHTEPPILYQVSPCAQPSFSIYTDIYRRLTNKYALEVSMCCGSYFSVEPNLVDDSMYGKHSFSIVACPTSKVPTDVSLKTRGGVATIQSRSKRYLKYTGSYHHSIYYLYKVTKISVYLAGRRSRLE